MGKSSRLMLAGACLLSVFLWETSGWAAMYHYKDDTGKHHYTNAPASGLYRKLPPSYAHDREKSVCSVARLEVVRKTVVGSYENYIIDSGRLHNVDPHLVRAVIKTESDFDCLALSKHGAQGLMQLMPGTAKDLRIRNPFDPQENIAGGTRYLRMMLDAFNGNVPLALAAYNAGPNLVKRIGRIPGNKETSTYVRRVLSYYHSYRGKPTPDKLSIIRVGTLVTI